MGNKDLRLLQTLINEEKSILTMHERLANDTSKGANALAAWGNSEGQDLSDVLTKAGEMLGLLVSSSEKGDGLKKGGRMGGWGGWDGMGKGEGGRGEG